MISIVTCCMIPHPSCRNYIVALAAGINVDLVFFMFFASVDNFLWNLQCTSLNLHYTFLYHIDHFVLKTFEFFLVETRTFFFITSAISEFKKKCAYAEVWDGKSLSFPLWILISDVITKNVMVSTQQCHHLSELESFEEKNAWGDKKLCKCSKKYIASSIPK